MKLTIYKNSDDFLKENRSFMEQHSIQANLIWANALSRKTMKEGFFGVSIFHNGSVYLANQTSSHPTVHFSVGDNVGEMAAVLADLFYSLNMVPDKISGIKNTVDAFRDAANGRGAGYEKSRHLYLMECNKVSGIDIVDGQYLSPITADFDFGPWFVGFNSDCDLEEAQDAAAKRAKKMVDDGSLVCFAVNGIPVTMAAKTRKVPGARCVSAVYTPDDLRGKGYCTACIKHLTQEILNEGNDCAFLFADKYNPASNRVYEKVGYKKIADFMEYKLKD